MTAATRFLKEADVDPAVLAGRTVAVLGYGSQGASQAQCLRDSGVRVVVATARAVAGHRAATDGFAVWDAARAAREADILMLLLPDEVHRDVYAAHLAPHLHAGQTLCVAHGFSVVFGMIDPPAGVDVILVGPKGPGPQVRQAYLAGSGLAGLIAVHADATGTARATALALAHGLGLTRTGVVECTFAAETHGDLFGEQVILCGGAVALMRAAFEVLTEAGYPAEVAYFECVHELKLIVDLVYDRGIAAMNEVISNTAEWGEYVTGDEIVDAGTRARMRAVLGRIRSGEFARGWMAEVDAGCPRLLARRQADRQHPVEQAGARIRALFHAPPA